MSILQPHQFSSSIFYPDMRLAESKDVILQPLSLLVWFSGAVPCHLAHSNIPIEMSVSLKDEYKSFTVPVMRIASQQPHPSIIQSYSVTDNDVSFPFLPLLPTFDHTDSDHWAELLDNIQSWLVKSVDPSTPEWAWGLGSVLGQFIKEWVGSGGIFSTVIDDDNSELATVSTHTDTLDYIRTEFSRHITLFYPHPLVSTS
ncbi:uncharacterized protein F5147DRAFT_784668 [Suillus discolor]|uniref:Uncharacterized protein n=1 Tax=Suillus discolor TaxID=1912936 RepID=A0A9P7JKN2_9AGAM|nr:uncharacterized protein F5147DRAFT_784668 [Suillus discolor]KAG2079912.1 hypothetical protein F5147DRAFT_784668 [Suillus discolor]